MFAFITRLPVQSGQSPRKNCTWGQAKFKSNRFVFCCRNGCSPQLKDLSRNPGERHSLCWNFKGLFHFLPPFSLWGATGQVLPGAALQIGTCLCAFHPKEVLRKGGQGNLISLGLFLQPSAKVALLGNPAFVPGVWERLGAPHDSDPGFAAWRCLSWCWAMEGRRHLERQGEGPPHPTTP